MQRQYSRTTAGPWALATYKVRYKENEQILGSVSQISSLIYFGRDRLASMRLPVCDDDPHIDWKFSCARKRVPFDPFFFHPTPQISSVTR